MNSVLVIYRGVKCQIEDMPYECGGVKQVSVKALEGKPFAGGDKWPVKTEYATARVDELRPVAPAKGKTLLDLALEYSTKQQWSSGEVVWLWGSNQRGAFLKEGGGFVRLCLVGMRGSADIFCLRHLPDGWRWVPVKDIREKYQAWRQKVQEAAQVAV